jgi:purine-binding chemotaxis protein CheW
LIALPLAAVREVTMARPLSPLPRVGPGLRGTLDLHGDIIPALDLHEHLGLAPGVAPPAVIVVLRHDGRLIGLYADAVCGMARPARADVTPLEVTPGPRPTLVSHSFLTADRSATVLDPAGIMALEGMTSVPEPRRRKAAAARLAAADALLTFRCGDVLFGVDALCVDATVPRTEVERNALTGGWCLGIIRHHGHRVAVLDACALFDVGAPMSAPAQTAAVVLRLAGGGRVALAIDAVCDIRRVASSELIALPPLAGEAPRFLSALLPEKDGSQTLIIDSAVVTSSEMIGAVARGAAGAAESAGSTPAASRPNADAQSDRRPYLLFRAGKELSTPLETVSEIIRYPARPAPLPTRRHGLIGVFVHKGYSVPLFDLVALLGGGSGWPGPDSFVLLVRHGEDFAGYAIESLRSIESGRWRVDTRGDIAGHGRGLAMIGADGAGRVLPSVDFEALFHGGGVVGGGGVGGGDGGGGAVVDDADWATF